MAKDALAVYDPCRLYIERLMDYAAKKEDPVFEIHGFTDLTILEQYLRNNKIKAVLFSQSADKTDQHNTALEILTSKFKNRDLKLLYLGEQPLLPTESEIPCINRFQPVDSILAEVREYLSGQDLQAAELTGRIRFQLVGIYCPWEKTSHPQMAAGLNRSIRKKENINSGRTLYINLEQFSGMEENMDHSGDTSISDLIFYYKTDPGKIPGMMHKKTGFFHGMDVLTAPRDWVDLEEIRKEEWPGFLSALSDSGDYQLILIDISVWTGKLLDVICEYGNLFIPALPYSPGYERRSILTIQDPDKEKAECAAAERMHEFMEYLKIGITESSRKKILEVRLGSDGRIAGQADRPA